MNRSVSVRSGVLLVSALLSAPAAAQGCVQPPPGRVVTWDAEHLLFHPWHHVFVQAIDGADPVTGPALFLAAADPSTAGWPTFVVDTRDGRTSFLADDTLRWGSPQGRPMLSTYAHPELAFTSAMSVELWFKSLGASIWPNAVLIDKSYYGNTGFMLFAYSSSRQLVFHVGQGSGYAQANSNVALADVFDGSWHHLAATFDSSLPADNLKLFVDGQLHGTTTSPLPMVPSGGLWLGRTSTDRDFVHGLFDQISFYDRALEPAEVAILFQAGATPQCRPLYPDRRWFDHEAIPSSGGLLSTEALDVDGGLLTMTTTDSQALREVRIYGPVGGSTTWSLQQTFPEPHGNLWEEARVSGDTVAAVSGGFASNGPIQHIFAWARDPATNTWNEQTDPNLARFQGRGYRSLALDGDLLAVGWDDWYQDQGGEGFRLFRRSGTSWQTEFTVVKPYGAGPGSPYPCGGGLTFVEELGYSLAIQSGDPPTGRPDRLFVGEPGKNGVGTQSGVVHVYEHQSGAWFARQILPDVVEPGLASYDGFRFGNDIEVDGDRLLVSAPGHEVVYVLSFVAGGQSLHREAILRLPDDGVGGSGSPLQSASGLAHDSLPRPMTIEGGLIVVAAQHGGTNWIPNNAGGGSAFVYANRNGSWELVSKLQHGYSQQGPFFQSVVLDGGRLFSNEFHSRVVVHEGLGAATSFFDPGFGAGCPGSAGMAPSLDALPGSQPVLGQTFRTRATNLPPTGPAFALLGFRPIRLDLGVIGAPGCVVHSDVAGVYAFANLGGFGVWSLPIPNERSLLGLAFHAQVITIDPPANGIGIITSNGARGTIGG